MSEAIVATLQCLSFEDEHILLRDCDLPVTTLQDSRQTRILDPKGFWRVDRSDPPETRQTVLSLVALKDLSDKIAASGGSVGEGINAFCNQNDGEGWLLPETLRLRDFGLGRDDRAREHQPVRSSFGPRFFDWQHAQTTEESWRECHLHARNLLGSEGYQALINETKVREPPPSDSSSPPATKRQDGKNSQGKLFETEHLPLFPE